MGLKIGFGRTLKGLKTGFGSNPRGLESLIHSMKVGSCIKDAEKAEIRKLYLDLSK